jgi:hypothetical protein
MEVELADEMGRPVGSGFVAALGSSVPLDKLDEQLGFRTAVHNLAARTELKEFGLRAAAHSLAAHIESEELNSRAAAHSLAERRELEGESGLYAAVGALDTAGTAGM